MGIKWYEIDGEKYCDIYVNKVSKKNRRIRAQRKRTELKLSEEEASRLHLELVAEASIEVGRRESQEMTWGDAIDKWELHQMRGRKFKKKYTRTARQDLVQRLRRYTKSKLKTPIGKLLPCDVDDCLEIAKAGGATIGLRKLIRWSVSVVYGHCMSQKYVKAERNICKDVTVEAITPEEKAEKIPLILNKKEIVKFVSRAREVDHPWFPVWFSALYTGMRAGELNALRKNRVELVPREEARRLDNLSNLKKKNYGKIRVELSWKKSEKRNGPVKGRWWRTVPVNSKLYWLLIDLMDQDHGSDADGERVFPKFTQWDNVKQAEVLQFFLDEIGIKKITFHTLRACFATQMLEAGVDRTSLMKIGGWKSEETMMIYVRLAGVDESGKTERLDFGYSEEEPDDVDVVASGDNVINIFQPGSGKNEGS